MDILLVEDNWDDARLTYELLREGNFQHRLTWLWNGEDALAFLRREGIYARVPHPDLILLDLGLPVKDGRVVLSEIKQEDDLRNIPVVVMTSSKSHEDLLRSEQLEVDGFVIKPVDFEKFIDLVKQLKQYWHNDLLLPVGGE